MLSRLLGAALLLAGLCSPAAAAKLGLVIGNDVYSSVDKLQKARNDADGVARALTDLGFDKVVTVKDASFDAMAAALSELEGRVEPGDTVFFFFAGHGVEIDNRNYLLPVDIPAPKEGQDALVRRKAFAADEVIDSFRSKGAGTVVAVLDACRDNPFAASGRRAIGGGRGLAQMTPDRGVFILFSAGAKQSALDRLSDADQDANSVFTRVFLKELRTPGADLANVAVETRSKVIEIAGSVGHVQTPAYYDQLTRRVTLGPPGTNPPTRPVAVVEPPPVVVAQPPPVAPTQPAAPRGLAEKEAFDLASSIGTVEAWDAFLKQFPAGAYVAFAKAAQGKARQAVAAIQPPPVQVQPPPSSVPVAPANIGRSTASGFIFPDSHRRALSWGEVTALSPAQLRVARNEIFARRGRFFQSADLDRYFRQFSWYQPVAREVRLSPIEEQNVRLIERAERGG
jgi:co-chaperonin GroES (HSP10)